MHPSVVLVVGESPSLGSSIADLLDAASIPHRAVGTVDSESPLISLRQRYSVVVVASSGYFCATGRRWLRGEFPDVRLVVVGSRDPLLIPTPGLYRVSLPLEPYSLLEVIHGLLPGSNAGSRGDDPAGPGRSGSA